MVSDNASQVSPFKSIKAIDYSVIFVRDMDKMRSFYEDVLVLKVTRELSPNWIEYQLGDNTLVLANRGLTVDDAPIPNGTAALQLAFRVSPEEVDLCALELEKHSATIVSAPTDHDFGHRTLFFRDPDGNLLEIFANI